MSRVFPSILPVLVLAACLDPLEGKRFACDPAVPGTCAEGNICVPVQSPHYKGLCMPAGGSAWDVAGEDPGRPDLPSRDTSPDPSPKDPGGEVPPDPGGPPEVPAEVSPETCVPDCTGRECGDDGCGGTCGSCESQDVCQRASCVEGACRFEVAEGFCFIDGTCWIEGETKPGQPCLVCKTDEAPDRWTRLPKGTACQIYGTCEEEGECRMPCWESTVVPGQAVCPDGYQDYDGCHCRVPPTGVVRCARNSERIPCDQIPPGDWYGQDGHFSGGPVLVESVEGQPSVWRDAATGILWSLKDTSLKFHEAAALYCGGLGTVMEWALPSRWVLGSVMDFGRPGCGLSTGVPSGGPLWPPLFGGDCTTPNPVWTASRPAGLIETPPLLIEMSSGTCRKSNWPEEKALGICAKTPRGLSPSGRKRFVRVASSPNTVYDRLTGLEWDLPERAVERNWQQALEWCSRRSEGWRLPNVKEILSLMDEDRIGMCPAWSPSFGEACRQGAVWWTSTPVPWNGPEAFSVSDDGVEIRASSMARSAWVMCVRAW